MTVNTRARIIPYAVLGGLALLTFVLPGTFTVPANVASEEVPETVVINGVVRDFHKASPNLVTTPSAGMGLYAGNVADWLPGSLRPRFRNSGYRLDESWIDSEGRSIAPVLAGVRGGYIGVRLGMMVDGKVEIVKGTVDAFNSNYGLYGVNGNFGSDALITTNATAPKSFEVGSGGLVRGDVLVGPDALPSTVINNAGVITGAQMSLPEIRAMPSLVVPENTADYDDLENKEAAYLLDSATDTLQGDLDPYDDDDAKALWFDDFTLRNAVLEIEGDLRIRCDKRVTIENSQINLLPGANLALFITSNETVEFSNALVNTGEGVTTAVTINYLGNGHNGKILLKDDSHVYATVVAPEGKLEVKKAHFYGGFIGDQLKLDDAGGGIHVDSANAEPGPGNPAITVREKLEVQDHSYVDSFDSNIGPYGGPNVGEIALATTNAIKKHEEVKIKSNSTYNGDVMIGPGGDPDKVIKLESGGTITGTIGSLDKAIAIPVVAPPAIATIEGDVKLDGGSQVISSDLRCKQIELKNNAVLRISGHITIRVDDKLKMEKGAEIRIEPNSSLALYVQKDIEMKEDSKINMNTGDPQLVSIHRVSIGKKGKIKLQKRSEVCAWIQGAKTELTIEEESHFYGSFIGRKVKVDKDSAFHVDMAYLSGCVNIADSSGEISGFGDAGIPSEDAFDMWYRDELGVNQAGAYSITLTQDAFGVWEYLEDDFRPIDDRLFGNEGESRNNYFTYVVMAEGTYTQCGGQFIEFEGGDGAWVFVNGRLVLDLAGLSHIGKQYVDLDRLGMEEGAEVTFQLFYAQRRSTASVFRLRTNLELDSESIIPSVTAMFD